MSKRRPTEVLFEYANIQATPESAEKLGKMTESDMFTHRLMQREDIVDILVATRNAGQPGEKALANMLHPAGIHVILELDADRKSRAQPTTCVRNVRAELIDFIATLPEDKKSLAQSGGMRRSHEYDPVAFTTWENYRMRMGQPRTNKTVLDLTS